MFFTTNQPNPDSVDTDAIEALNQFIAGERNAIAVGKLSDLDRATVRASHSLWLRIPTDVRRFVVHQMLEQAEANVTLNFARLLVAVLDDPDAEIRALAIHGIWEDESTSSLERLLHMLEHEPEPVVREAIAEALGTFSLLVFEEAIDAKWGDEIRRVLFGLYESGESIGVHKKSLISLACFSDDPDVETAILDAFESPYHDLQTAAIFAMGLNLNHRWFDIVLQSLSDEDPETRYEAVRAIGRFGDERAVTAILDLLEDEDREVQLAAIEALGEIGGKTAMSTLRGIVKTDDVVIKEAAEEALHVATIVSGSARLDP